ncbi:PREDICTED: complement factor H-like [Elephantulus edwardii]|uniref:complement factor H-like n=1 Tax=Elephantulus edwardii TaxID=28737 RepID=UPI0003F0AED6|nr:PREDICTED: complement factor H-like [Elephantulus edwardii]
MFCVLSKDCQEPPPRKDTEILQGSWNGETYTEGTRATYKCRPGFRTLGTIARICSNGEWVSLNPSRICQRKPCGHPGDTPFGSFKLTVRNEFEYGAKVVYTCSEGYQLIGAINYRECEPEGWSNHIPLCEVVKCSPVTEPENGRVISDALEPGQEYSFGQVVRFECDSRFKLDGPQEIHCSADGTWSGEMPNCVEISCSIPEILNGRAVSTKKSYKENERLQYKCNQGFEYTERGDATCTKFGWSPSPSCKEVICNPPYIVNGDFSPARIVHRAEDEVTYQCKRGFYPATKGNRIKCTSSGWIPAPRCSLKPCDFPEIKNGYMHHEARYKPYFPVEIGKYYYYSCHPGFDTASQSSWDYITCTKDGWSPKFPCRKTCLKSDANIQNGFISEPSSKYNVNKKTPFQCKQGFVTSDGETVGYITCLESGWSSQPICIKSCGKPVFENARAKSTNTWYKLNDKLEYECSNGYENRGGNTTGSIVCGIDGWSDTPTCYDSKGKCEPPPPIENGDTVSATLGEYAQESRVEYQCQSFYELQGDRFITCRDGQWSQPPKCLDACVISQEEMDKHNIQLKWVDKKKLYSRTGDFTEFECKRGYTKKRGDVFRVKCQEGKMKYPQLKPCDFPEIKHGYMHNGDRYRPYFPVAIGKYYYYSCHHGFETPSQSSWDYITCTKDGWSPKVPCRKTCLKSDANIQNGFISELSFKYNLNDKLEYECSDGYENRAGNTTGSIVCDIDGWSDTPTCYESCGKPVFENARAKSNATWYKLNDKLEYECSDGYENRGGNTTGSIVCGSDGWSDTPTCYELECNVPVIPQNVDAQPKKDKYKVGEVLKFSCRRNLKIVGADSIQCYHFGWSPNPPECKGDISNVEKVTSCDPPPQLPSGKIKGENKEEYVHSEVVEYDCNSKFLLKGSKKIQCVDGEWTTLPVCVEEDKVCGDIPVLENGVTLSLERPYHHGESVKFRCRESFTMIGYESITCVRGMWTQLPQCVATEYLERCKFSKTRIFESIEPEQYKFIHNSNITYKCKNKPEYKQSTCINGRWFPEPTCTEILKTSCPPPPHIPNARDMTTTVNYQNGEKVSLLCQENYLIQGTDEILCQNGRWQSIPRCFEKIPCSTPPHIEHGFINSARSSENEKESSETKYPHGTKLTYICKDGFKVLEENEIRCDMGKWSTPPQCVDDCVISPEEMEKHNIQLRWINHNKFYSRAADITEFICKPGYKKKNGDTFRVTCQEGKVKYPQCI